MGCTQDEQDGQDGFGQKEGSPFGDDRFNPRFILFIL
jgi:hypothetical protein